MNEHQLTGFDKQSYEQSNEIFLSMGVSEETAQKLITGIQAISKDLVSFANSCKDATLSFQNFNFVYPSFYLPKTKHYIHMSKHHKKKRIRNKYKNKLM